MKRLMMGSVLSAGMKVVSAGLTFLMFMLLARVLSEVEYGLFASMFALGSIGAIAALFGQHTFSIKTLSALGIEAEGATDRRATLRRSYQIALSGVAVVVGLLLGGGLIANSVGFGIDMRYLIGACMLVLPLAMAELVSHQYRAFGAIVWALAPRDMAWRGIIVLACLGTAVLPFLFTDALSAMATVSGVLLVVVSLQMVSMLMRHRDRFAAPAAPQPVTAMPWSVTSWMWLASLGTMGASLNLSASAVFLPADQVGAYFAAQKTAQLLQLPIIAINMVAAPAFARMYSKGDFDGLRAVGRKLAMLIAGPLAIGAAIMVLFAAQLLSLFNPAFAVAALALMLLAGSYMIIGCGGPARQLMLMSNGERPLVRLTLISEIAGLALIPVLVPAFGILGAAVAACVTRAIFIVTAVIWCRRHLGVDTSVLSLFRRAPAAP